MRSIEVVDHQIERSVGIALGCVPGSQDEVSTTPKFEDRNGTIIAEIAHAELREELPRSRDIRDQEHDVAHPYRRA